MVHNFSKICDGLKRLLILPCAFVSLYSRRRFTNPGVKLALGGTLEQIWIHLVRFARSNVGLLKDFANALEGDSQRFEVLRLANGLQRHQAFLRVHQVVGAGTEYGTDFIVAKAVPLAEDEFGAVQDEVEDLSFLVGRDATLGFMSEQRFRRCTNCQRK